MYPRRFFFPLFKASFFHAAIRTVEVFASATHGHVRSSMRMSVRVCFHTSVRPCVRASVRVRIYVNEAAHGGLVVCRAVYAPIRVLHPPQPSAADFVTSAMHRCAARRWATRRAVMWNACRGASTTTWTGGQRHACMCAHGPRTHVCTHACTHARTHVYTLVVLGPTIDELYS